MSMSKSYFFGNAAIWILKEILIFNFQNLKEKIIFLKNIIQYRFSTNLCSLQLAPKFAPLIFAKTYKIVKINNIIMTYFFGNAAIWILKKILMSSLRHLKDKSIFLKNITHKFFSSLLCSLQVARF